MADRQKTTLTKLELQIMQVIWKLGACNVTAVQEGLEQRLAYTTVQTMLNILQRKGHLKRALQGRSYVYSATVTEAKASRSAVRDLVDRMFGGSTEELVMSLIKNKQIDAEQVARLSRMLDEKEGVKMRDVERWILEYLLNSLWQVPLIFAAAWMAARIARRGGPLLEHRIWVTALLLQTLLPACSFRLAGLLANLRALLLNSPATGAGWVRVVEGPATISGAGMLRIPPAILASIAIAYGLSVAYFAARLAWGLWRTRVIASQSQRVTLTSGSLQHWQRCARIFRCEKAQIAVSTAIAGPMTIGGRQGIMLVPAEFLETSSSSDLDVVIAHEFAHMHRRDFLKNLVYAIVSLPVAYHPVAWLTRARIAESREMVCDEMAAEAVAGRENYVRSLLRLASLLVKATPDKTLHAIGIFDANIFERRVMNLTQKHFEIHGVRRFTMAAACVAMGIATCASALTLRMNLAAPAPPAARDVNSHTAKIAAGIMAGQVIYQKNPTYPAEAKKNNDTLDGSVVLRAIIGKDGTIHDLSVQKSLRADYDHAALDAVKDWVYKPYLLNGNPTEVETTVTITYNIAK